MRSFQHHLTSKFLLRYHMGVILLGTGLSGVLANKWLLNAGFEHILARYPTAVIVSFLSFLLLMRLWLSYVSRAFQHPSTVTVSDFDDSDFKNPADKKRSRWDWDGTGLDTLPVDEPCGCLLGIFVIVALGIAGIALLLIAEAPLILAEATFQFLLAAGLIRSAKKIDNPDWVGSILSRTWKPFLVVFIATILLGSCAEINCKNPTTIKEMIRSCGE